MAKEEWSAALADHRAKASEAVASAADRLRAEMDAAEARGRSAAEEASRGARAAAETAAGSVRAELEPRLERALQRAAGPGPTITPHHTRFRST